MSVLPRDGRLYKVSTDQEYGFLENLLIGIFDYLKTDAYYNMVSAGASGIDKAGWRQVVANAPKPLLHKAEDPEEAKAGADYVHPRDALKAVRRMISQKAYNQVYGSK